MEGHVCKHGGTAQRDHDNNVNHHTPPRPAQHRSHTLELPRPSPHTHLLSINRARAPARAQPSQPASAVLGNVGVRDTSRMSVATA